MPVYLNGITGNGIDQCQHRSLPLFRWMRCLYAHTKGDRTMQVYAQGQLRMCDWSLVARMRCSVVGVAVPEFKAFPLPAALIILLVLVQAGRVARSSEPNVAYSGSVRWDEAMATLTITSSGSMPATKEGFFWDVPPEVDRVVIGRDVRFTGGFRVRYRAADDPLVIRGEDRATSEIFGTEQRAWTDGHGVTENDKWRYGAINVVEDATVHVRDLTVLNPRGYLISGYADRAVIHVDHCSLLDTRGGDNNNSDGFIGASGSSIRHSLISTRDDGIKIYHDITIEDVVIEHQRNGAPLQFGWGGGSRSATAEISRLTIRGVEPDHRYNMAPMTWEAGEGMSRTVNIDGLVIDTEGSIYDEGRDAWTPIGWFELKPPGCRFDLTATGTRTGDLPEGRRTTPGRIRITPAVGSPR